MENVVNVIYTDDLLALRDNIHYEHIGNASRMMWNSRRLANRFVTVEVFVSRTERLCGCFQLR